MATWNAAAVADAVIAHKKGITLQQGRALRDNPIAIAEGAPGAPKVRGQGLGGVFLGRLSFGGTTGVINLVRGKTVGIACAFESGSATNGSASLGVQYTADNGSSWGSTQSVGDVARTSGTDHGVGTGWLSLDLETGAAAYSGVRTNIAAHAIVSSPPAHTVPANCNGFRLMVTGNVADWSAVAYLLGGVA